MVQCDVGGAVRGLVRPPLRQNRVGEEWGIIQTYMIECNPSKIMLDTTVINYVGQTLEISGHCTRHLKEANP